MRHVFARLAGYGLVLMPHWPYTFERHPVSEGGVQVTRWTDDTPSRALVVPSEPETATTSHAVDVEPGPDHPAWLVETSRFGLWWPAGFTVDSPQDRSDRTPFYLHGPEGALIFPQGPVPAVALADPDVLVAEGQTVADRRTDSDGTTVVELTYDHEGAAWWQTHVALRYGEDRILLLTGQSPLHLAETVRTAIAEAVGDDRA
ncbi:hypothetical protein KZZ52_22130 [Dactylosporangium sp. AC04546]|uniref:hypothetical protein n=1 Tax=Dactylosporangium sp. AC04546 TaxID=2862460 RepID=UPI001EDFFBA9|nr:hypothetical protein [Dactylosporangium sp. AC04546]WVK87978.1 hypothetical protein KZZ52_22130 [Dactylosporangium sp. AC04546]